MMAAATFTATLKAGPAGLSMEEISASLVVPLNRYPGRTMARPKQGDDATKNLKPEDETQVAPKGTKIGLLRKDEVMAAFRKVARGKPS
jgi:hypothetical protein